MRNTERTISEIEYLIMNENNIDWDVLSADKDKLTSIIEVRLFRKRINWKKYILSHRNTLNDDILEIACKYFSDFNYLMLENFGLASEEFIRRHLDKFSFPDLIMYCDLSKEFLLEYKDCWKDIPNIKDIFSTAKKIDINNPDMSDIRLILETL